jgi:hypothetical protein
MSAQFRQVYQLYARPNPYEGVYAITWPCHSIVYDAAHEVVTERPEAPTNTINDFLDLRATFIVSRRDARINP